MRCLPDFTWSRRSRWGGLPARRLCSAFSHVGIAARLPRTAGLALCPSPRVAGWERSPSCRRACRPGRAGWRCDSHVRIATTGYHGLPPIRRVGGRPARSSARACAPAADSRAHLTWLFQLLCPQRACARRFQSVQRRKSLQDRVTASSLWECRAGEFPRGNSPGKASQCLPHRPGLLKGPSSSSTDTASSNRTPASTTAKPRTCRPDVGLIAAWATVAAWASGMGPVRQGGKGKARTRLTDKANRRNLFNFQHVATSRHRPTKQLPRTPWPHVGRLNVSGIVSCPGRSAAASH